MALDPPRAAAHGPGPGDGIGVRPGPQPPTCSLMDQAEVDFDSMDILSDIDLAEEFGVATPSAPTASPQQPAATATPCSSTGAAFSSLLAPEAVSKNSNLANHTWTK
eukprot:12099-Pyramimonas_sp.AAC.1